MVKLEKKMSKKLEAVLKKKLNWKAETIVNERNDNNYDVLLTNHKDGVFYFFRVYDKSIALLNHNLKDVDASAKVTRVLYDFFIA